MQSVHQGQRTTQRWVGVGGSSADDPEHAGRQAAAQAVTGDDSELLVVYGASTPAGDAVLRGIRSVAPDVPLVGCSTVGAITVDGAGLHHAVLERMELEGDPRRALDNDKLRLVYQPIVELTPSKVVGVEALLCWHHPERGVVSPATFIPVAEEIGTIIDIGRWVLRRSPG